MNINLDFHQLIEQPWKKAYFSLLRETYLDRLVNKMDYSFSNHYDEFIRKNWHKIKHLTLIDPFRLGTLIETLESVKDIDGDIVECGSYKGGSAILMGIWLRANGIDKKIHLFDSFEGLPEPDSQNDSGYKKGQFYSNIEEVREEIHKHGLSDMLILHQGWFENTVPKFSEKITTSLLHIDCDLYTSTNDCLPFLFPTVSKGGAIIFDDLNDGGGGEKRALHEYLETNNLEEVIQLAPASQAIIKKGLTREACNNQHVLEQHVYSWENLALNKSYLQWMIDDIGLNLIEQLNIIKMTKQDIFNKVEAIFLDVLDEDKLDLADATTADDIEEWDSLTHVLIIAEIEKRFNFMFKTIELDGLKNVGEMLSLINKKVNSNRHPSEIAN